MPAGFLWGAATAAHQVEGGNRWNDWWALEEAGRLPHRSGEACRHYELFESDFDLARSLGHNAHRLSLEWSRIEPEEGRWNEGALAHYAQVMAALLARGLEPFVTLQHFTLPAWLARRGGWLAADAEERYLDYVARVSAELSGVRHWITINEPTVYVKHAYVSCDWPPCGARSWPSAVRVLRKLGRAHVRAYDLLHRKQADARVGIAHSAPYVVPCDPGRAVDRLTARLRNQALNVMPFRCFGRPVRESLDFIGINYYARQVVRSAGFSPFGRECTADHHGSKRHFSQLGWEVHPEGLRDVLHRYSRFGLPLYVTENGIATRDEDERTRYLRDHVASLARARTEGVDVRGYFWWSLMDNYEWAAGREPRFGLCETDYATQERRPRPAAAALRDLIVS